MKNLKKIIVGAIVVMFLATSVITFAQSSDWTIQVLHKASADMGEVGFHKKQELITNIDERIAQYIADQTDGKIEIGKQEVADGLEKYFNQKLNQLTDTPDFQALDGEIDGLREEIINRYKTEIDAAFGF